MTHSAPIDPPDGTYEALARLAAGAPVDEVLASLVVAIERAHDGVTASVLVLDDPGRAFDRCLAPSLPDFYNEALRGLEIGEGVGACGTAAFRNERFAIEDMWTHPFAAEFHDLLTRTGLRACWSQPIESSAGQVLGTFAFYYREPREPEPADWDHVMTAAHVAGVTLELDRTHRALKESEERYRTLFDHAPEAILVYDAEAGRFVDANENAVKLFGYTREELYRLDPSKISDGSATDGMSVQAFVRARLEETLAGKAPVFEWPHRDKAGNVIPTECALVRLPDAHRALVRGSVVDIRERKEAESKRAELERQVRQAQKFESLGILAGGIAHDFNNLLVGILGNASLVELKLDADSELTPIVDSIQAAARRASGLVHQLLSYSGKAPFSVEPLDLNHVVREMTDLLDGATFEDVELGHDLAADLPSVSGDATQLRQVVKNLITNASEAIGEQAGEIVVSTGLIEGDVFLEVRDTGCGMEESQIEHIFDPFYSTKFSGHGLGLAAALGIVRGHGGTVEVETAVGAGSTFRLRFPAAGSQSPVVERAQASSIPGSLSPAGTVLIADDEPSVSEVARSALEWAGFEVLVAEDGRRCVETFSKHREEIGVVLLDLNMPYLRGAEVLEELRRLDPEVRVVLTSGYDERDDARRYTRSGRRTEFLQKPYPIRTLIETIRKVVAEAR